MVTVSAYKECKNSRNGIFYALILQGDTELIKSSITGKMYATARKVMITSTFDELTCKALIGKQMPGSITKVVCDEYNYTIAQTKETVKLTYCYEYNSDPVSMEEAVFQV